MLDQVERARDQAAFQALRAHEAERSQIALELHDQIGQSLTAIALHAEALSRRLTTTSDGAESAARAARLGALAQDALSEVQSLSRQLRPPLLDDAGLVPALGALAAGARERLALDVRFASRPEALSDLSAPGARLPSELETALYRIAQECLTNAARHGNARHVWIRLRRVPAALSLLIVDDGQGFNPRAVSSGARRSGLGLVGMRERARLVGGTLRLRTRPGAGCAVLTRVPLPSALEAM
jgi:two-component system sensor histidine kinase UhpB